MVGGSELLPCAGTSGLRRGVEKFLQVRMVLSHIPHFNIIPSSSSPRGQYLMLWATFLSKVAFFAPAMQGAGSGELERSPSLACWSGWQGWEPGALLGTLKQGGMALGCLRDRTT